MLGSQSTSLDRVIKEDAFSSAENSRCKIEQRLQKREEKLEKSPDKEDVKTKAETEPFALNLRHLHFALTMSIGWRATHRRQNNCYLTPTETAPTSAAG